MVLLNGMKDVLIPMDQAGRIVLPKGVRQELALKPGDVLRVSIRGLAVTLTPNKETTGFVRKGRALVFSTAGEAVLSAGTVEELLEGLSVAKTQSDIQVQSLNDSNQVETCGGAEPNEIQSEQLPAMGSERKKRCARVAN